MCLKWLVVSKYNGIRNFFGFLGEFCWKLFYYFFSEKRLYLPTYHVLPNKSSSWICFVALLQLCWGLFIRWRVKWYQWCWMMANDSSFLNYAVVFEIIYLVRLQKFAKSRMLSEFHKEIIHLKTFAKFSEELTCAYQGVKNVSFLGNFASVFKWIISLWNSDSILNGMPVLPKIHLVQSSIIVFDTSISFPGFTVFIL